MTRPASRACRQHANVAQFHGTREAQLLATESHRLLHAVEPVLCFLLELTPPAESLSLLDAVPMLKLQFNSPARYDSYLTDDDRPGILSAFAAFAQHSQRLGAFPELKTAFWLDVLLSDMIGNAFSNVHKSLFKNAAFPAFVVDFSFQDRIRWCRVSESLGEELLAFMTTRAALPNNTPPPVHSQSQLPAEFLTFGLSFANCSLTVDSLEIIEGFLDRAFAHLGRQFAISSLDLSENAMKTAELAVVARIVEKSKRVYEIEELKLDAILPVFRQNGFRLQEETPREFLDILRSALDVNMLAQLTSIEPPIVKLDDAPSRLRKISMSNSVRPTFSAVMFSALRYGCPLEEDVSSYVVSQYKNEETNVEHWRWLAFGLFYPRPKRFVNAFKLRTIGRLTSSPLAIRTLVSTLRNPAAELVYGGKDIQNGSMATNELMVCTVKKGASVEIFGWGQTSESSWTGERATWTDTLAERSELEALCEQEDGSVCVVVPGVGLGWVQRKFVECIKREMLEHRIPEQDGWFDAIFGVSESETHVEDLKPMVTAVGRQFRSLTFEFTDSIRSMFGLSRLTYPAPAPQTLSQMLGEHCVNLKRLHLNSASAAEISGLLDALNGELGHRLLVLNLNGSQECFNDASAARLAALLAKTENPLVLQELRLNECWFGVKGLGSLNKALRVNRILALIELTGTKLAPSSDSEDLKSKRKLLDAAHQDQLLQTRVPMEIKLAFLGIVGSEHTWSDGKETSALNSLDPSLLSLVFQFAASREVRRTIAWNTDFTQHY
ncbi:hypothetical protein Gpo141_00011088 [Globisporangium polare]